jgi:2'-5' RNA ligase
MKNKKELFFIALLPPEDISKVVREIKQHFARTYNSKAALKSPPHITLQPPFPWDLEQLPQLEHKLKQVAQNQFPIPMTLNGFAAFKPRVIYINVLKTPELLKLHQDLREELETSFNLVDIASKNRGFNPHLTVASRDLSKTNFYQAWEEFKEQKLSFNFILKQLTLLRHNGQSWDIYKHYLVKNQENKL